MAGREAASVGIHWTFAPMLDITRDPRWGRVAETLGEDPFVTSTLGAAMVRGFQNDKLGSEGSVAACAKHYVGYGAAEGGRDYNTTWIPEMLLRDVYLPPFHAAREAGVATVMSAFNDLNGVPTSGNAFTLRKILREEWKFDGMVVSDYNSITEMINHGYAADAREAALRGILAGVDMEMVSTSFYDHGKSLVDSGLIPMKDIDDAVRDILRVKLRMGLFDQPVKVGDEAGLLDAQALEVAKRLATESLVLLKNEGVLPLAKTAKVAVIGPLADSPVDQMGSWVMDGRKEDVRTPLAALRKLLGDNRVAYVQALRNSRDTSHESFAAAVEAANGADFTLLFLGEEQILSGEAHSRAFLNLPGAQEALVDELAKTGKPMIAVIMAGRPLTFQAVTSKVKAVLYAWHPGTMGGPAIADVLFGNASPSGKLTITFPRTVGQVPIYYANMNTGRPPSLSELGIPTGTPLDPKDFTSKYLDVDFTPEYPFGFGLSYTVFQYSNLRVLSPKVPIGQSVIVSAEVMNNGSRESDEIVQLYVRDLVGSVTRPVRELKGFKRIHLAPGQKQTVEFTLRSRDLAFHNQNNQFVTEPGKFQVWIAPDSERGVRGEFELVSLSGALK